MSEWISVKEKLPKTNNEYLCVLNHSVISLCSFAQNLEKVDELDFNGVRRKGWYDRDSEWGYYEVGNVTHWMPLPELPKELENNAK